MEDATEFEHLIRLAGRGNRNAFDELYERTIQHVSQTVHFLVDDPSARDDVIQEVYIALYHSLPAFDPSKPFRPWLTGIVVRLVSSYRRKRWLSFRLLSRNMEQRIEVEPDFSSDLLERLNHQELLRQIERLPYKLKQAIILRYLHDYSQEEVAQILEIPVGTVKSRINAALQKLRRSTDASLHLFGKVETGV